jgi:serine/threonine-protein kinase
MVVTGAGGLAPDTQVAGYRIVRLAGRGASGELYLAYDEEHDRPAALKLLSLAAGDDLVADALRRFVDEAKVLAALRHPDIVAIRGAGGYGGRAWIAMEWVPGHDLDRYTAPAFRLPDVLALGIVERVARALAHAHRHGVVHRDVKPHNIRVNLPASVVKLADFGAARADDGTQTRTGVILGTPAYMAPEQLSGAAADARSDLYSLGVTLFELLSGRRPHESASLGELLRQVSHEPAPDLRSLRPELPPSLADELARVLSRQPSERHADGDAFADALERARLHIAEASGA